MKKKVNEPLKTIFYLPHYACLFGKANFKIDHAHWSRFCLLKCTILLEKQHFRIFQEQLRATVSILKTFVNFREKHLRQILFLKRLQAWRTALLLKANSPAQVFSCEICKIFKNTAPMAASKILYRTTRFWKKRPIHFMKTKYTMLNFTNVTQ